MKEQVIEFRINVKRYTGCLSVILVLQFNITCKFQGTRKSQIMHRGSIKSLNSWYCV